MQKRNNFCLFSALNFHALQTSYFLLFGRGEKIREKKKKKGFSSVTVLLDVKIMTRITFTGEKQQLKCAATWDCSRMRQPAKRQRSCHGSVSLHLLRAEDSRELTLFAAFSELHAENKSEKLNPSDGWVGRTEYGISLLLKAHSDKIFQVGIGKPLSLSLWQKLQFCFGWSSLIQSSLGPHFC